MGTREENTPSKAKPSPSSQEIPTAPTYTDWSSSMQAYYTAGATPPPFFASTVASPTPHPYLWGSQHPLIPPYGTPVPYPAIYPPGGVYAHPNMPTTPVSMPANPELEGKSQDGKDRASAKKSKANSGNAGLAGGKTGESGKATSGSGNDGASQSADSGSEGSSDASDDNQQESANKKGSFGQMLADASVPGKPVGSMPATNLNIGMDLWNASPAGASKLRPNPSAASSSVTPGAMMGRDGAMPDQWIQDEREIKRQKRKQSNRESARRSRLRKQAECEELQVRVENLNNENRTLREELQKLSEECEKLNSENSSIKEELTRLCGPEVIANLEHQSRNGEGKS